MKKITAIILMAITGSAFGAPYNGMNSNSRENLVSARFGKVQTGILEEKGDADIQDNVPKNKVNLRPATLADLNKGAKKKSNGKYTLLENVLKKLLNTSYTYLEVPYLWGGSTKNGIDCSAFVQNTYFSIGVTLPRVSRVQATVGKSVSLTQIRQGDLMFFYTDSKRPTTVTHVGMYIGNGKIIHASSSNKKVVIAKLENGYFLNKLAGIKRIVDVTV